MSIKKYKFEKAYPVIEYDVAEMTFFQRLVKNASDDHTISYNPANDNCIIYAEIQDHHYKELIKQLDERGYDYVVEECY